jgi:hypothetical protein
MKRNAASQHVCAEGGQNWVTYRPSLWADHASIVGLLLRHERTRRPQMLGGAVSCDEETITGWLKSLRGLRRMW